MKDDLKKYLEEQFLFEFGPEITEESDLFKAGILDSFGYISLMGHIEQEYGVDFAEEGLRGNIMVSLAGIVEYVNDALGAQSAESR